MTTLKNSVDSIKTSAFFDEECYLKDHPDVALSGLSPAEHYLRLGWRLGRNPGPDFDAAAYLEVHRDVRNRGENPLWHFEAHGRGEGRQPKPTAPATDKGPTRVDVVVPVYNALEDVKACLKSLAETRSCYPLRALVINDGSNEDTSTWLREACASLESDTATFELIEHPENRGYTKAVNTGLKASDAPYVVTLNSDTVVTDFWLDGLITCMRSDPTIGVVGPLSNAASWQNVPELYGGDGKFAINALPEGLTANDMADIVRRVSKRSYPRSTFVNGFCFMIRQDILAMVGYMDEIAFPIGYGEENDFCVRVQDAGFSLAFADDTYVFHAKSKSFGSANKEKLSKAGGEALHAKHGIEKFKGLVQRVAQTDQMDEVRAPIKALLRKRSLPAAANAVGWVTNQRVLFVLPVRGGGGGAHSVIQEVTAMRALGVEAKVAIREADLDDFMRLYGDIDDARDLFAPFSGKTLAHVAKDYDVLVATIFTSVKLIAQVVEQLPWILPAYYAQDYEPMFFEEGIDLWQEAFDSYTAIPGALLFAKTHWIGRTIEANHEVQVHKVEPSIDHSVYCLDGPKVAEPDGTLCVTAMIRPKTPRRGAKRTMQLLSKLKAEFGNDLTVRIFGCDETSEEFQGLPRDFDFISHGILTRREVAALLRSADMFIDLSDYQAFGRTGLEAMACGTLSAVPDAGGGREYAIDGINALIVDTMDVDSCFASIVPVLRNRETLATMQLNAIETASRYSPSRAAISELLTFAPALSAWREKYPKPELPRVAILPDTAPSGRNDLPGRGNERLPSPLLQTALQANWDIRVQAENILPSPGSADIAIVQGLVPRQLRAEFDAWHKAWRQTGARLIYDLGNRPDIVLNKPERFCAEAADIITLANGQDLPDDLAGKGIVVPSFLDRETWKVNPSSRAPNTPLRIGYFGTKANLPDIQRIAPTLEQVLEKTGSSLQVVGAYQNDDPIVGTRIGYFKRRKDPNLLHSEFSSWLQEIAQWDIVIIPDKTLDPTYKFARAATLGTAIICADTPDVRTLARHEENCLLVSDTPEAWSAALMQLIEDPKLRERLATAANQDLNTRWIASNNANIYHSVLEKALNAPR